MCLACHKNRQSHFTDTGKPPSNRADVKGCACVWKFIVEIDPPIWYPNPLCMACIRRFFRMVSHDLDTGKQTIADVYGNKFTVLNVVVRNDD